MAIDLEAMRAKLEQSKNGYKKKGDSTKWRPEQGDQTIRILPTADGDPFKEYFFHYNVGKNPGLLCPKKNYGENCPICDFASKLWREGVDNNDDVAKREAKNLFARNRYYSPILVRGMESEGVKVWAYGKTAYQMLLGYVLDPDYGDITDPETGTDIVLNYDIPGTPGSFPKTTLKPRRRPSVLCDDAVADCATLLESIPEIAGLFERKTGVELETLLNAYMAGDQPAQASTDTTAGMEKYNSTGDSVLEAMGKLTKS
tara:strand:- start:570 stop:1343 length:774 start_codon:yes stop_codon:yes gene_type:complete